MSRTVEGKERRKAKKNKHKSKKKKNLRLDLIQSKALNEEIQNERTQVVNENVKLKKELTEAEESNADIKLDKEKIVKENIELKKDLENANNMNKDIEIENNEIKIQNAVLKSSVAAAEKKIGIFKNKFYHQSNLLTSVSRNLAGKQKKSPFEKTKLIELSADLLEISEEIIGQGTFGCVKLGKMKQLAIKCAVKSSRPKYEKYFDAQIEASYLHLLQGSKFVPYLFGTYQKMLVMEYLNFNNDGPLTLYKAKMNANLDQNELTLICYQLTEALFFIHKNGIIHNDLKSNNVLLRSNLCPVIVDFGKATLRTQPEEYNLTDAQKEKYNVRHPYLAYELRNLPGSKTSMASDIFSLGFMFNFVAEEENALLQMLQKAMQEQLPSKRMPILSILKHFEFWSKKNDK